MTPENDEAWRALVRRGKELRRRKSCRPNGKPKHFRGQANSMLTVPENVRRWIVERANGASVKEASRISGATWEAVNGLYRVSEECRRAVDAMNESKDLLERETAYSLAEEYLVGACSARRGRWALMVLGRLE